LLDYNLTRGGYQAYVLSGNKGALKDLEAWKPDLIVLDVMLPGRTGSSFAGRFASPVLARTPVLFLTARSDEVDRVLGLEIGGDDYMTKPFSPRELVARMKAHLRRADTRRSAEYGGGAGPFRLDRGAHRVFLGDAK
jgi:DNA-binding response OmpR family regulator